MFYISICCFIHLFSLFISLSLDPNMQACTIHPSVYSSISLSCFYTSIHLLVCPPYPLFCQPVSIWQSIKVSIVHSVFLPICPSIEQSIQEPILPITCPSSFHWSILPLFFCFCLFLYTVPSICCVQHLLLPFLTSNDAAPTTHML